MAVIFNGSSSQFPLVVVFNNISFLVFCSTVVVIDNTSSYSRFLRQLYPVMHHFSCSIPWWLCSTMCHYILVPLGSCIQQCIVSHSVLWQLFYCLILSKMFSISQYITCFWSLFLIHGSWSTVQDLLFSVHCSCASWFLISDYSYSIPCSQFLAISLPFACHHVLLVESMCFVQILSLIYLLVPSLIVSNVLFTSLAGMATMVTQELGLLERIISLHSMNAVASQHLTNSKSP